MKTEKELEKLIIAPVRTETPARKLRRKRIVDKYFKKGKSENV